MRIAVCDDEADVLLHNRDAIRAELLGRGIENFKIDLYLKPSDLLAAEPYNLIFLDIEMPGSNGIETAKLMRKQGITAPFVYVTDHLDYAFAAYAVFPLSLVKKPLYPETIRTIIDEFLRRTSSITPKSIEVQTESGSVLLLPSDIIYFNCIARNDIIAVTTGAGLTVKDKFEDLCAKITKYNFFRIRRDIIVNLSHVKAIEPDNRVIMSNETVLNVSHRLKNDFLTALSDTVIAEFIGG